MSAELESVSWGTAMLTYLGYGTLILLGWILDRLERWFYTEKSETLPKGLAPLTNKFEYFYTRRLYGRVRDCWNRPVSSCPGARIDVELREPPQMNSKTLRLLGEKRNCLNLGSYNYLGFSPNPDQCNKDVCKAIDRYGVGPGSSRVELGTGEVHQELEETVARFLGKEAAICFGMGYATNSTTLPSLVGKGGLIISDSLNHASLITGCKHSNAKIKVFKHNDPEDLERVVRAAIIDGQPKTHRPWKKILIVVEGIYSMEGEICRLKEILEIKKKYRCYLYVDEAHSIGALGERGRGICDYWKIDPAEIDILMGTFTKSFGSVGGYITGSRDLIDFLRYNSFSSVYDTSLPAGCSRQVISAMKLLMGEDGTTLGAQKIRALRENSNFFRRSLEDRGFKLIGDEDSPVIPLMLYLPSKIGSFSRFCFDNNLAVVVVGFPATPLLLARVRFCISAAHKREDLVKAVEVIDQIGDLLELKLNKHMIAAK